MSDHLQSIKDAVINHNNNEIKNLVNTALEAGLDPDTIINDALILSMDEVGRGFSDGTIFVPEMMLSAMIMQMGLDTLKPHLQGGEMKTLGTVLMCTVKGDLHDIGKNIVSMMISANGFKVIDLGIDQAAESIAEKIDEIKPDILGMSALLTTTLPEMQHTLAFLDGKGLRDQVKVIVGGAPVDKAFADNIGADGYARDASEAVKVCKQLLVAG